MGVARRGGSHEVGDEFCLVHDAVDALGGIVEQLGGMFDGRTLDVALTAVEEEVEEQREDRRDDEHDEQPKAQRKALTDVASESFHEPAGSLMSWSRSSVIVSLPCMMSACKAVMSSFERLG